MWYEPQESWPPCDRVPFLCKLKMYYMQSMGTTSMYGYLLHRLSVDIIEFRIVYLHVACMKT